MDTENRKPKTENRLFRILTLGCKVNQCDTAGLAQELAARGWRAAPPGVSPDLVLVNTCTVTARADQQARQAIRRLAREHPGVPLWVTGCYAQRSPVELAALPGVVCVLGNSEKANLVEMIEAWQRQMPMTAATPPSSPSPLMGEGGGGGGGENIAPPPPIPLPPGDGEKIVCRLPRSGAAASAPGAKYFLGASSPVQPFHPWPVPAFPGHTRPRLKVQDGCAHACSYCIVPQVRGPGCSLPPGKVTAALEELAAGGYQEVVLTGVNLGQYGRDLEPRSDLTALLRQIRSLPRPPRLRLSSLEPQEVTPALLQELAAFPGFCPHFHLPLQSGAAPVLATMGRNYAPEDFRDLVREIHRHFPGAGLGLDVLVGFPGETRDDFDATHSLVESLPVTYLHVFPFSPRPGTPAAKLLRLPAPETQLRAKLLRDLGQAKKRQFLEAQIGQTGAVLVEGPAPRAGWLKGLSANYLRVLLPGPLSWRNRILPVRFREVQGEALLGEALGPDREES